MKTVPFSDILASVCQLTGLDRNTLNDKSFAAIRDMMSRRISTIWDREEWPESERRLNTFVGNPITSVTLINPALLTEIQTAILQETEYQLWTDNANNTIKVKLALDLDFPRVYLAEFAEDAYKRGTIEKTYLSIQNPFYILQENNTKISSSVKSYQFTYESAFDAKGEYIKTVTIDVPYGIPEYVTYAGPNGLLTSKVIFESNPSLLIQLDSGSLQGLEAYNKDPRTSTRGSLEPFLVEDFSDRNDIVDGGSIWNEEYTYLRFLTAGQKFIRYRQTPNRYFGTKYSSSSTYSIGSQVFFDPYQGTADYNPTGNSNPIRGDFWNAVASVPLAQPPSNVSAYWKMTGIPYRFKDFLINGVSADFLRSEGRADEANVFEGIAETAIQQQIDVLVRQQGQVQRMNMVYSY